MHCTVDGRAIPAHGKVGMSVDIDNTVADPGGVRGVQMHPPFEGLPSRVLSSLRKRKLRTLMPTLTIVEYHNK